MEAARAAPGLNSCRIHAAAVAYLGSTTAMPDRDIRLPTSPEPIPPGSGRHVMAAIGIDRYQRWQRLGNAVRDATRVTGLFQQLGFEQLTPPLLNSDATGKAIQSLVTSDLRKLGAEDSLVIFYAGHGASYAHRPGGQEIRTGYLIPVDAGDSADDIGTWIDLDSWLRAVALLPAKHILVILDACRSGIALDGVIQRDRGPSPTDSEALATLRARRSRRIITSALADQVALDNGPKYGHSLFAGCLIDGLTHDLRQPSQPLVTGSRLGMYLQQRVDTHTGSRQTPDFGCFYHDERGELAISLSDRPPLDSALTALPATADTSPGPLPAHMPAAAARATWPGRSRAPLASSSPPVAQPARSAIAPFFELAPWDASKLIREDPLQPAPLDRANALPEAACNVSTDAPASQHGNNVYPAPFHSLEPTDPAPLRLYQAQQDPTFLVNRLKQAVAKDGELVMVIGLIFGIVAALGGIVTQGSLSLPTLLLFAIMAIVLRALVLHPKRQILRCISETPKHIVLLTWIAANKSIKIQTSTLRAVLRPRRDGPLLFSLLTQRCPDAQVEFR